MLIFAAFLPFSAGLYTNFSENGYFYVFKRIAMSGFSSCGNVKKLMWPWDCFPEGKIGKLISIWENFSRISNEGINNRLC